MEMPTEDSLNRRLRKAFAGTALMVDTGGGPDILYRFGGLTAYGKDYMLRIQPKYAPPGETLPDSGMWVWLRQAGAQRYTVFGEYCDSPEGAVALLVAKVTPPEALNVLPGGLFDTSTSHQTTSAESFA